ncbi:unnamed protein product [Leptosia nina]|uniref:beta-glucosidase n=1 Tax=Leptosia nina TaxID=320188 RepID=A0AAV1JAM2_9NEOP
MLKNMKLGYVASILVLFSIAGVESETSQRHEVRKFPEGFLFGTATASYQVEGAWNANGKSENIWDHLAHTKPCLILDCSNGDIADDSYHLYKRDVEMMRELGLDYYSAQWYEPESEEHEQAAKDLNQFMWAQYVHPIFSETGDYPPAMKERIAAKSAEQGYSRSRLIEFTSEEIEFVRGTSDAFGLNHYTTRMAYRNESVYTMFDSPSIHDDVGVAQYTLPEWQIGESQKVHAVPWGFYKLLSFIRAEYGNPSIYITENGFATFGGLNDDHRVYYYREYLSAMLDAIEEGSDVKAYTAWSLMDNFEWRYGYTERFGLYEVDYDSTNRTRTPRKSAYVYKEILRTRTLDPSYEPDMSIPLSIDEGH